MHDLRTTNTDNTSADSGALSPLPQSLLHSQPLITGAQDSGELSLATFKGPIPPEDGSDLSANMVQQYFSSGNSVGEWGEDIIEKAEKLNRRTVEVDESYVIEGLTRLGYVVTNGVVSPPNDPLASSTGLSWRVSLDELLYSSGSEFFKSTVTPLIEASISESPLPPRLQEFTADEMRTYLVQLWPTIKVTPRGLVLALTQPQDPISPWSEVSQLLKVQIAGILQDERGMVQGKNAKREIEGLMRGSDVIALNPESSLVLRPRPVVEDIENGGFHSLTIRPRTGDLAPQNSTVGASFDRVVDIGGILEDNDGILFTEKAHLGDYERSLKAILQDPDSSWRSIKIAPEVEQHCLRYCEWFSGDKICMPDGTRASEKIPYWLVAASVESRFPEKVKLIMNRLEEVYPATFTGKDAVKFWKLHAMDAGEDGHGEKLIRTVGACFPPAGVDSDRDVQLKIATERLVAVAATAEYFSGIVEFDKFMVNHVTQARTGKDSR